MNIKKLIDDLTIDEKIGQLLQLAPFFFVEDLDVEIFGHVQALHLNKEKIFQAGSVLGNNNATEMIKVQKRYLKESRHKIPLIFMADIVHGFKTIFPVPLAMSTSFNPRLVYEAARIQAKEARVSGIQVTFSPMADISHDPRWGRVVEGFGEDPYLTSEFTRASIKGYQGVDLSLHDSIAACVKHFAAYGASESGRDYNTADINHISLYNIYLPTYKAAVDAGVKLLMTAFNTVDHIPATVNEFLLRDILRKQWHYKGVVISDYDSLHQVIKHGVAKNDEEAAYLGLKAGLDIEMQSTAYVNYLESIINKHPDMMKLLDQAVYRVLKLKKELGLFKDPYAGADPVKEQAIIRQKNHLDMAEQVAMESMVLLKNNNHLLPLDKQLTYALIGPYSETKRTNGPWAGHGDNALNHTLNETLSKEGVQIIFNKATETPVFSQAEIKQIKMADILLIALGENEYESGEAHAKAHIKLPRNQEKFMTFAKQLKKKTITLLYHGRPFDLTNIMDTDALLDVYYLGSRAHEAIAKTMVGKHNPSGKLTMTYPKTAGQIPIYYNHLNTGRPKEPDIMNEYVSFYLDEDNEPLFPFGFGLSYATFEYSNLVIDKIKFNQNEAVCVSIDIANNSNYDGYETVQLYIRDLVGLYARPVKELKAFKKVWIAAHHKQTISFELTYKDLTYYDIKGNRRLEPGEFQIIVGPNSRDTQTMIIELIKENFHDIKQ